MKPQNPMFLYQVHAKQQQAINDMPSMPSGNHTNSPGRGAFGIIFIDGHGAPVGAHRCIITDGPVNRVSNGCRNRRGIALGSGVAGRAVDLRP